MEPRTTLEEALVALREINKLIGQVDASSSTMLKLALARIGTIAREVLDRP